MTGTPASEWLKLRTVRSTYYCLGVVALTVVLTAALAWYAAGVWDHLSPARRAHFALSSLPDLTGWVACLVMGVLGVLTITSEYATGMIRVTLTAAPRRRELVTAKAVVIAGVALGTGQAAGFATLAAARLIIGDRPIHGQRTDIPMVLATGLSVMVFALIGFGLGAVLRSTAGAIVALVAVWHIVPLLLRALPAPWDGRIGSLMPGALAGELAGTGGRDSIYGAMLPPLGALALMAAYIAMSVGAAAISIGRRDV